MYAFLTVFLLHPLFTVWWGLRDMTDDVELSFICKWDLLQLCKPRGLFYTEGSHARIACEIRAADPQVPRF